MLIESISFLISGAIFGLVAGISPGPLLTLVISETFKHNIKEGFKVACVPLLTDVPIVFVSVFFLSKISASNLILGIISLTGAVFLLYLSYEILKVKGLSTEFQKINSQSLKKGFITNILNPHPYLFWITVGGPTVLKAFNVNVMSAFMFISGFYMLLVGSKIIIVLMICKSKTFLSSTLYIYILRFLGLILLIFALTFIKEALKFFGFIYH